MPGSVTLVRAKRLSVVIPAHNEAAALAKLLPELKTQLNESFPGTWEILVIDDGSTDETVAVAESMGMGVRLLRHAERRGSGASRKTGSRAAAGELIAWIDGDGTYPAEALAAAFGELGTADQVVGARSTDFGRLRVLRMMVKNCTARIASWLWGTSIPDLNSGLRVFRRGSLLAWLEELPDGFSCTTTATLAALNHRQRVIFHPILYRPRQTFASSKFHPLWDTLRLWRVVWHCWRCRR